MKRYSRLQRQTSTRSDRLVAKIQPRSVQEPDPDQPLVPYHSFSHVDLFSHAPPHRSPTRVQMQSTQPSPPQSALEDQLNRSKTGGSPLPTEVRSFMEPRFGADFSQVRVHTDSNAIQMNRDLSAEAFTHGQDVFFGAGRVPANDALTAHELTHVVQQAHTPSAQPAHRSEPATAAMPAVQRKIFELWNWQVDKPAKKSLNTYTSLIKANWAWANNDVVAPAIAAYLITTLGTVAQLDTLANSNRVSKAVYDYYKSEGRLSSLISQLDLGATAADLTIGMTFLQGDKTQPTAANLEWWHTNHPASVRLSWSHWFPYTNQGAWDPPTHDPEISVSIGRLPLGRIHMHYGRYRDAIEGNITSIHIKPPYFGDDRDPLGDAWKARCQARVNLGSRPALPALAVV